MASAVRAVVSRRSAVIGLLTLSFVLRGVFFDLTLPYGDPMDEPFHYAYAAYLAESGRPPRATTMSIPLDALRPYSWLPRSTTYGPKRVSWTDFANLTLPEQLRRRAESYRYVESDRKSFVTPNYQAQHPPLFYLAAAGILRLVPRAPLNSRLLLLRLFATACAALAVPLTYRLFRRLLPRKAATAACAVFVALPGVGSLVGRVTNDALALPIATILLVLLIDIARGRLGTGGGVLLVLTLAAGCWTKLYFLPLLAAPPIASWLAPVARRRAMLRRTTVACSLALALFLPWLIRQYLDTGAWLGLGPSKMAVAAHVGVVDRLKAVPDLLHIRYGIVFGRTFLWPGTGSAMGAPAVAAVFLTASLLVLLLAPAFSAGPASPRVRRGGLAMAVAASLFLLAELLYSATYAAIARSHGQASPQVGLGWYAAILTAAVLSLGCAFGRSARRSLWIAMVPVSMACGWWFSLGVLPGVYSGATDWNGSNAPFWAYGRLIFAPMKAMRIDETVGLMSVSTALLLALWLSWQMVLVAGVGVGSVFPAARRR